MADEVVGTASVVIELDDGSVDANAQRLGDRIEQILDRSTRDAGVRMQRNIQAAVRRISPVKIRVEADTRPLEGTFDTFQNFDAIRLPLLPDVDRARFEEAITTALSGLEVSVRVVPDLDTFDTAIRAHNPPTVHVNVEADRSSVNRLSGVLSGLGKGLGKLGKAAGGALGIGAVGIAAASATQSIFALTAALAPAAGALAALPAAALGGAVAIGTLKLALSGVGDAFGAALGDDAAKFEKALAKLSPSAQAAAREVRALKPSFDGLKSSVQDAFFSQFEGQITAAAKNLGPLKTGLQGVSAQFGAAVSEALKFGASKEALSGFGQIIDGTRNALSGLATATGPVISGFVAVAASVSKAFGAQLGTGIANAGKSLGGFLTGLAESGRAVELVRAAAQVFQQLGAIASNVGSIISGVFNAANDVGGGLLNNLVAITEQFKAFVQSAAGQSAIGNIFATLSQVAAQLGPILSALVTQVGALAPALAPLFTAIGPAITQLIGAIGPALGPVIAGVKDLVNGLTLAIDAISSSGAFDALGTAIGSVASAIAPLLPVVGQLVGALVASLAPAITAIANAVQPVVVALAGALTPVIPVLAGAITTLVTALTPLVTLLGQTLAQVITALAPLFATLAGVIAQIATAIAPLIVQLTSALVPVFQAIAPVITSLVAAFTPLLTLLVDALLPILPPVVDALTAVIGAFTPLIPVVAQLGAVIAQLAAAVAPFVATLITAIGPAIQFAAEILKWTALNVVTPLIKGLAVVLTEILTAIQSVLSGTQGFVPAMVSLFTNLNTLIAAIVQRLGQAVVQAFVQLQARAVAAVSALPGLLGALFLRAQLAVVQRVQSLVGQVISFLATLPGKAASALSGAAGALVSAGRNLIQGMINGVRSAAGALASAAKSVVSGAISAAKSALGIASPSKVFIEIGKFTAQGFIKGLLGSASDIKAAADKLVSQITDAFKGKNTRLDDILIARVRAGQKQLEALAVQREALAERIKQANEFAATTTKNALSAFSLSNLFGQKGGNSATGLADQLNLATEQIKRFNAQVNNLANRGLRKDLLAQIIGLGPQQGAGIANAIAGATAEQLKDLNAAQKALDDASKKLGTDSADKLFDAGAQAAKGFLAGLKAQQKDIQDLMLTLAKQMAAAIRKALGIKSPSRVFKKIGGHVMAGLGLGIEDRIGDVRRSALGAARAITEPFGAGASVPAFGMAAGRQTGDSGRTARAGASITNTFNITAVGNAEATAERVINRMVSVGGVL